MFYNIDMKTLDTKEWVAVVVSIFVVGFFFIFGPGLISLFTSNKINTVAQTQELGIKDELIGTGDIATLGSRVTVHYTGRFMDGKVFDSSVSRNEPFQFVLGGGQVIAGWDKGVVGMRVGGKRTLTIPSNLGYGPDDFGPIPGGSTLIFDIELLKVEK
jgi:FKBP-type peptidyl-prolyl cis-trans isomerase